LTVRVRVARAADAPALASLAAELGYPTPAGEMLGRLEELIADTSQSVLVAEDHEVVGWLHVALALSLESGRRAEILGLVVTRTERAKGIGKLLVDGAEEWAAGKGATRIRVRTNVVRDDARRFYARCGYTTSKRQEVFDKVLGGVPSGGKRSST